ncbi:MAG: DeoR family transcriptional regulator [Patescibacteria group bacterium]|jgi:heat-inducible transcriptional repressor
MLSRKEQLFKTIVRQHIALGEPVGSKFLVDKAHFDISPATCRNDMAELENEGYLTHPHTSAGRVPTEKGWRWYLQTFMEEMPIAKKNQEAITKAMDSEVGEQGIKQVAKVLAELSKQTAIVGFSADDMYYTGLSNLFAKPEFNELDLLQHLSEVVDHLDQVMRKFFKSSQAEVEVLIGKDNPIDEHCSLLVTRLENKTGTLVALLGPMRMDYDRLLPLIKFTRTII